MRVCLRPDVHLDAVTAAWPSPESRYNGTAGISLSLLSQLIYEKHLGALSGDCG